MGVWDGLGLGEIGKSRPNRSWKAGEANRSGLADIAACQRNERALRVPNNTVHITSCTHVNFNTCVPGLRSQTLESQDVRDVRRAWILSVNWGRAWARFKHSIKGKTYCECHNLPRTREGNQCLADERSVTHVRMFPAQGVCDIISLLDEKLPFPMRRKDGIKDWDSAR